jgi:hypothetical protein
MGMEREFHRSSFASSRPPSNWAMTSALDE